MVIKTGSYEMRDLVFKSDPTAMRMLSEEAAKLDRDGKEASRKLFPPECDEPIVVGS